MLSPASLWTTERKIGVQGALLVIGALLGVAQTKLENHHARQILSFVFYGVIVVIAINSISLIVGNWARIDFASEGGKLLLPIAMTAAFLPFLFVFTLFAAYQTAVTHMRATVPVGTAMTKPAIALVLKTGLRVRRVAEVTPRAQMFMAEATISTRTSSSTIRTASMSSPIQKPPRPRQCNWG